MLEVKARGASSWPRQHVCPGHSAGNRAAMLTILLIVLLVVLLFGGGGYYARGRRRL
jgi:hypothetical protein